MDETKHYVIDETKVCPKCGRPKRKNADYCAACYKEVVKR